MEKEPGTRLAPTHPSEGAMMSNNTTLRQAAERRNHKPCNRCLKWSCRREISASIKELWDAGGFFFICTNYSVGWINLGMLNLLNIQCWILQKKVLASFPAQKFPRMKHYWNYHATLQLNFRIFTLTSAIFSGPRSCSIVTPIQTGYILIILF